VLSKALEVWGLTCENLASEECRPAAAAPEREAAFICNLREHWFAVRALGGAWWDFNSLLPAPRPLSQFYLSAFLDSLRGQGYSLFVVRGPLPGPFPGGEQAGSGGAWFTPEQARGPPGPGVSASGVRARARLGQPAVLVPWQARCGTSLLSLAEPDCAVADPELLSTCRCRACIIKHVGRVAGAGGQRGRKQLAAGGLPEGGGRGRDGAGIHGARGLSRRRRPARGRARHT